MEDNRNQVENTLSDQAKVISSVSVHSGTE